jgi:hypothetical protein
MSHRLILHYGAAVLHRSAQAELKNKKRIKKVVDF